MTDEISLKHKLRFIDKTVFSRNVKKPLSKETIEEISRLKNEPKWMQKFRLKALAEYGKLDLPSWAGKILLDVQNLSLYLEPTQEKVTSWEKLPKDMQDLYEKVGVPREEISAYLGGSEMQFDSEAIYGSLKKKIEDQGVIFTDTDTALKKYPKIFEKYFAKIVLENDNKFAALNSAFWSGGSFIYVPKGVKVELPLQAYFRINARRMGQFERTLIIADEGSSVRYIEGCSAPLYGTQSLHAGVVEIYVLKDAKVEYITVQNWSNDVFNLVTKRAKVEESGTMRWLDVNIGSALTMKYPSCLLCGIKARGEMISLAIAGKKQCQDTGARMIHLASETTSNVLSKSISVNGGKNIFRGKIVIDKNSANAKATMRCESLIIGESSSSESFPNLSVERPDALVRHEATISKIEEDQLFYLQSRGLTKEQAEGMIVNGFADMIIKDLPLEYSLEIKKILQMLSNN